MTETVDTAAPAARRARSARGAYPAGAARVLLLAGRREARWLAVSPLTLAGFAVSAWLIWLNNHGPENLWWSADVNVVACLLAAAGGVLIAAQLAAARPRRDAMEQLYASYPASAAVQAGARLAGAAGPLLLSLLVTGAAVAWLDTRGALGSPRLWVLAASPLLVALGAVAGSALGGWLRHPIAAFLVVLVAGLVELDLVLSWAEPVHLGAVMWAFPWADPGGVLTALPGTIVPLPPPAHLAELAGLVVVLAVAALWPILRQRRAVAAVAVLAVAVAAWGGWSSARPVPQRALAAMVAQTVNPASVQQCQSVAGVQYCYYPAFAPLVAKWAVPVSGVLARAPAAARRGLTVRQIDDEGFLQPPLVASAGLTSNGPVETPLAQRLDEFSDALSFDPDAVSSANRSPVYTDLTWDSSGPAQLALAVSAADWVTGLPTTYQAVTLPDGLGGSYQEPLVCVPVGQAREAVAVWLAVGATSAARGAAALSPDPAAYSRAVQVGKTWMLVDQLGGAIPIPAGLTVTATGAALAAEMLRLPTSQVTAVLSSGWQHWLSPQTSEAELASALGLRLPVAPAAKPQPDGWVTGPNGQREDLTYPPPSPVCE